MTTVRTRLASAKDDGFTLPELIIYSLLIGVVLAIIGTILISMLTIERSVRTDTAATTSAQLAANTIQTGIRNARAFTVVETGLAAAEDQLLIASVASDEDPVTWHCTAWYFSAAESTIRYKTSAAPDTPITTPTSAQLQTWTLLAEDVQAGTGGDPFLAAGSDLTILFETVSDGDTAAAISSSATSRAGDWVSAPCF